jgi:hypothetical protein
MAEDRELPSIGSPSIMPVVPEAGKLPVIEGPTTAPVLPEREEDSDK